ncbi:uncharacterized protein N7479_009340 [Penicillium vulpinum]|uniref:Uncharacterized protein n=1 Tax=Penicillium vulpinum TaxID=29845 RepID=A0A1V6RVC7_9EURO|nr:uncharacterized protein N7479_009340 [Penicillium vulpinum]KAJ5950927.1 hypothetical protein N7479_009340 [Penicillium vulpinum]OQE05373.1 hypothetical protein PENVUL_c025G09553 [Penicillium vulpinum]
MAFPIFRPAFVLEANILGQLETAGTAYFDTFVAVPGTRATINSVAGFVPVTAVTAAYVDTAYTEIILGENSRLETAMQMTTQEGVAINMHISGSFKITFNALNAAREGVLGAIGLANFTFESLEHRLFVGEGYLFMGSDNRLDARYSVSVGEVARQ